MKYRCDPLTALFIDDDGPWFETRPEAAAHHVNRLIQELKPWIGEAKAALEEYEKEDDIEQLWRGGGILMLSDLMRKIAKLRGSEAASRFWDDKHGKPVKYEEVPKFTEAGKVIPSPDA